MKPAKPADIVALVGNCSIHIAVVKAVGYGMLPYKDVIASLKDVIDSHGQVAVDAVARSLLDYEQHGSVLYAKIKLHLHVHCRMLLSPMPSEWDTWWKNGDGSDRKGKPKDWPPKLPGPPQATDEEMKLRAIPLRMLADSLHEAQRKARSYSPKSKAGQQAWIEVAQIEAEYARRNLVLPVTHTSEEPKRKLAKGKGGV